MKRSSYSVLEANLVYMVMAFVLMTFGAYVQEKSFVSGIFITEYLIVLAPVILLGLVRKIDLKKALRLNPLTVKQVITIMALSFALLPTVAFVNVLAVYVLSLFDKVLELPIPTAGNFGELGLYMFLISFSAGLCEEFFFRGMMLNAFENKLSKKWGVIISAVLFGVFHFNMQNLLGPIVLGLVFGYIVQLTDSLWAGVLAHATNNGIAVILGYFANKASNSQAMAEVQAPQLNDSSALLMTLVFLFFMASLLWIVILKLLQSMRNDVNKYEKNSKIRIRGVDYLILSQYNGSVAAVQVDALEQDEATRKVRNIELNKLKKLNPQNMNKLWDAPLKEAMNYWHYLPWLGVVGLYAWYVNMHLTYVG